MPKRGERMSFQQRAKIAAASRKPGVDTEKRCHKCGIVKPAEDFYRRSGDKSHLLRGACKACDYASARAWLKAHPKPARVSDRRRKLRMRGGISMEEYEERLAEQEGVCAICHQPCVTRQYLAVDHCHSKGHIRGLLCMSCNTGLGCFHDRPQLLLAAISYLERDGRPPVSEHSGEPLHLIETEGLGMPVPVTE